MSASIYNGVASPATIRAGVAFCEINGEAMDVAADAAYDATNVKREMLLGQSGIQGFSEMPKAGFISLTLRDAGTLSVANLFNLTACAVNLILANGKRVYGAAMTCTECSEVKTQEGTFDVKFEGYITESST